MQEQYLNVARIIENTEAEGPGKRFALWVQGCPFRCKGWVVVQLYHPHLQDVPPGYFAADFGFGMTERFGLPRGRFSGGAAGSINA